MTQRPIVKRRDPIHSLAISDIRRDLAPNVDPVGDGKRLYEPGKFRNALLPAKDIKVLMRGEATDIDGKPSIAEAVYYESPAGAKVFNAGTIRWSWGLSKEGSVEPAFLKFNENLVRNLLE